MTKTIYSCGKRDRGQPIGTIDEAAHLLDIQRGDPHFFTQKFGKRETYTMHRGQLIVRYTRTTSTGFGFRNDVRETSVYLFFPNGFTEQARPAPGTYCISAGTDVRGIRQAKKLIDQVLDGDGKIWYGFPKPESN